MQWKWKRKGISKLLQVLMIYWRYFILSRARLLFCHMEKVFRKPQESKPGWNGDMFVCEHQL